MSRHRVSVVQMTSRGDVEENLLCVERLVREAAQDRAELVVLPECFALLGPEADKLSIAESIDDGGPILRRCQQLAKDTNVELVLGGFWERSSLPGKVRNTAIHLDRSGDIRALYRKIHLFDVSLSDGTVLSESSSVEPGDEVVVTDSVIGKLGLSICYDVRFPELYRRLNDLGAIAMAVPAAFTATTGKDHWHVLMRARAIESQSYVLAAAQTGHHFGSRSSYGHALIVDPWGVVVAECGEGEGLATAWIEADVVARVRASLPSLQHRRLIPSGSYASGLVGGSAHAWFDDYTKRLDEQSVGRVVEGDRRQACPCCACLTFDERGSFEICPVCYWEDDGQDGADVDIVRGGPNGALGLERARQNYATFGACEERFRTNVRPPTLSETSAK